MLSISPGSELSVGGVLSSRQEIDDSAILVSKTNYSFTSYVSKFRLIEIVDTIVKILFLFQNEKTIITTLNVPIH